MLCSLATARLLLGFLVSCLALVGPASAVAQGAPVQTIGARQLLAIARGGLSSAAEAAKAPLNPTEKRHRPFWAGVDAMGRSLDAVQGAFLSRSPVFFDTLEAGSRALSALETVWSHAGVDDPGVRSGLEILSASYRLLRESYGREASRRRQGGSLTPEERQAFQAMQEAQAALARRWASLRRQAVRARDRQGAAELARLAAQARSIAQSELTLEAYLAARLSAEALQGEWEGESLAVKPALRKAWQQAAPLVEDLATDSNVGFVFSTDLSQVDAWAPLETPVEVPAGVELGSVSVQPAEMEAIPEGVTEVEVERPALGSESHAPEGEELSQTPATPTADIEPAEPTPETGKPAGTEPESPGPAEKADGKPAPPPPIPAPVSPPPQGDGFSHS
jgi:hypothetical protein